MSVTVRSRFSAVPVMASIAASVAAVLIGCSGEQSAGPEVTGTITLDGEPVTHGEVGFASTTGSATGTADIESDGSYRIKTSANYSGLPPGKYYVTVTAWEKPPTDATPDGGMGHPGVPLLPVYTDAASSGLTAEVTSDGDNVFNFDLDSNRKSEKVKATDPLDPGATSQG